MKKFPNKDDIFTNNLEETFSQIKINEEIKELLQDFNLVMTEIFFQDYCLKQKKPKATGKLIISLWKSRLKKQDKNTKAEYEKLKEKLPITSLLLNFDFNKSSKNKALNTVTEMLNKLTDSLPDKNENF